MKKTDSPIIVEGIFDSPIEKVWEAITNLDKMKLWYFNNIDSFKPEVGSKSRFSVQSDERTFTHLWEVTEVNAPHKIAYNWKYEEHAGDSFVSFGLEKVGDKIKLTLTVTVAEDFDDKIPEFKSESCQQGWEYFICSRLAEYLKKST